MPASRAQALGSLPANRAMKLQYGAHDVCTPFQRTTPSCQCNFHLDSNLAKEEYDEEADVPCDQVQPADHDQSACWEPWWSLELAGTADAIVISTNSNGVSHQNGSLRGGPVGNLAKFEPMLCVACHVFRKPSGGPTRKEQKSDTNHHGIMCNATPA